MAMTPQEIFEYKRRWMQVSDYSVIVNEDLDFDGKRWCKAYLKQHQWNFIRFASIYEHTFCFEHEGDKHRFEEFLKRK
jgi:hypothetical protein